MKNEGSELEVRIDQCNPRFIIRYYCHNDAGQIGVTPHKNQS